MRIIRDGDLKNLTITLQDLIKDNSTGSEKPIQKRSAFQFPLSASPRQKRAAEMTVNGSTSAAPTPVTEAEISAELVSVDIIPITPYIPPHTPRNSYEVHVRFLDVWCF